MLSYGIIFCGSALTDCSARLGTQAINVLPVNTFNATTPTPDGDIVRIIGIMAGNKEAPPPKLISTYQNTDLPPSQESS
jgi:hypothetical protein